MADQVDFPDIYIDASAGSGGVGSEADPYDAIGDINWTTGGDNSIYDYYAGTPSASVTINLKKGEEWVHQQLYMTVSGTETYPIYLQSYGTGDNPLLDDILDISTASYKWTLSQGGTNEYYLEAAAGGDPSLGAIRQVFIDGVRCDMGNNVDGLPVVGSLTNHQFVFDHNSADEAAPNSKGVYDTVYIRDDTGDPDTEGTLIEASDPSHTATIYLSADWIIVDGISVTRSNGHPIRFVGDDNKGSNCIVRNCYVHYTWNGIGGYPGANNVQIIDNEIDASVGEGSGISGTIANPMTGFVLQGNYIHDVAYRWSGGLYWEAAGTKLFAQDGALITKNTFENCGGGGVRLDGLDVITPEGGCMNCEVSYNAVTGSEYAAIELEFSGYNTVKFNYVSDLAAGCNGISMSHNMSDSNDVFGNIIAGSGLSGGSGIRVIWSAGEDGNPNYIYNNVITDFWRGIGIYEADGAVLRNNITDGCVYDLQVPAGNTDLDSDYNCWSKNGVGALNESGSGSQTLAAWQTNYSAELNSISDDPLLTDVDNEDFTLSSGSPCLSIADNTLGTPYNEGILSGIAPDTVVIADRDDY